MRRLKSTERLTVLVHEGLEGRLLVLRMEAGIVDLGEGRMIRLAGGWENAFV